LRISNEDKVECATYMLEEEAAQWWRSMQRAIPSQTRSQGSMTDVELGEAPQMSWERFKELFNGKFFPTCWKLARAREFMSLRQGPNMLVAQYEPEFLRLIKYMPLYGMDGVETGRKFCKACELNFNN